MEKEEEYTFVTIDDGDFNDVSEGFIVDVDGELSFDAIMLDEEQVGSDLITLSDDTVFMTDADVIDMSSMNLDDSDVSFML
ncbi:MAG: hypothetical protein KA172_10355 [Paludibacter sp.]|jgi:hypothetical protein|nr:hypothetical protein [Paludibacter sp.]MBP9481337.1 hypothetical protein [Parabacteroides sp.]MBP9579042.1 hypothetical protein [Parabacteroides sp.]MDD4403307.1 hypothetical protein [Parabacteroides sp.]